MLYVLYGIEARYQSLPGIEATPTLTRQPSELPQSSGSLLYVLYVLYGSYTPTLNPHTLRAPCYMSYMYYVLSRRALKYTICANAYLVHVEMLCV